MRRKVFLVVGSRRSHLLGSRAGANCLVPLGESQLPNGPITGGAEQMSSYTEVGVYDSEGRESAARDPQT
jgi:hypothetical protein